MRPLTRIALGIAIAIPLCWSVNSVSADELVELTKTRDQQDAEKALTSSAFEKNKDRLDKFKVRIVNNVEELKKLEAKHKGNPEATAELGKARQDLLKVYRNIPVYDGSLLGAAYVYSYMSDRLVKYSKETSRVEAKLVQLGADKTKIGYEGLKNGTRDPVSGKFLKFFPFTTKLSRPDKKDSTTKRGSNSSTSTSTTSGFGSVRNPEVYVISMNGPVEFYVNGTKVEHRKQHISLAGKSAVELRALFVDGKRKESRNFQITPNLVDHTKNDYQLKYTVSSGNFNGTTDWKVASEKYGWSVNAPSHHVQWQPETSKINPAVADDVLKVTTDVASTVTATANATVDWNGTSILNGQTRPRPPVNDQGSGSIQFAIGPAE